MIAAIAPATRTIDLTDSLAPFDVAGAAAVLADVLPFAGAMGFQDGSSNRRLASRSAMLGAGVPGCAGTAAVEPHSDVDGYETPHPRTA